MNGSGTGNIWKADTLEQARRVLGLPYLKDKIICFVSTWERTKATAYMPAEDDEKEYSFQELRLFEAVKNFWLKDGDLSFIAFREFGETEYDQIDFEKIEKAKSKFGNPPENANSLEKMNFEVEMMRFLGKNSVEYIKLSQKMKDLVGHDISVFPIDKAGSQYIQFLKEEKRLVESHKINILCIDYEHFPYFIINHFLKYLKAFYKKEYITIPEELKPLYRLFKDVSVEVKMTTYHWLKIWIDRASRDTLKIDDWDKIEFLSMNHLQNISLPNSWADVKKIGYLCSGNAEEPKTGSSGEHTDIRIFYSFESLLLFEFRNCLRKVKRCNHCNSIIESSGQNYKGRYCTPASKGYKECFADRNRKRQKKHYSLTKN